MTSLPTSVSLTRRAFTLLELMTVLVVVGILVVMVAPALDYLRARSQKVQCIANLRSLHVAASTYIQDNHHWPQIATALPSDPVYAQAWLDAFRPYGLERINWICPAVQRALQSPDLSDPVNLRIDYFASTFSTKPGAPYQFAGQPWFIETADVHGNGQEILFPDGHIEEAVDILKRKK